MSAPHSIAFATAQLDRLMGFFPRVESKASFILALNIAMLGILALNFPVQQVGSLPGCFGIIAALALAVSLFQLYVVFFPHLKPGDKLSLIYFGDIGLTGWRAYHQSVETLTDGELLQDLTCQIWRNAEILTIKFDRMRSAFIFTALALPFWMLLLGAATIRAGKIVIAG